MNDITNTISDVVTAANQIDPNAPAIELASAALSTGENPSPSNIIADIELIITLVKELKAALNGMHPSIA